MDFLNPKKKRAHRNRLFVGYGLMAVILAMATLIIAIWANGYAYDRKTGDIIQNGLLFVDAHPEPASIALNGEAKGQTDARLVLPAGNYHVKLTRKGYRSWERSFVLEGSTVERLVYPFLFPEKLKITDVQLYGSVPGLATESPDRNWIVLQQPQSLTKFDIVDTASATNTTTTVTLPASVLTPGPGTNRLEMVEWSTDNRHVLLKHSFDGGNRFIIFDREAPASSININTTFNQPITDVKLRDKRFDELYLYKAEGGVLQTADVRSKQVTPLLTGVLAFKSHGADTLLYATRGGVAEGKVSIRVLQGSDTFFIREVPISPVYLLDLARFDNEWYVAVGASTENRVYLYREPFTAIRRSPSQLPLPMVALRVNSLQFLSFSANTRFVAAQGGSQMAVFDLEHDRLYRYDTGLALSPGQKITWMDGHRLMVVNKDKVVVFDYDHTNVQTLVAAYPSYELFFDRDYNELYSVSPSVVVPGRPALTRTELKIVE